MSKADDKRGRTKTRQQRVVTRSRYPRAGGTTSRHRRVEAQAGLPRLKVALVGTESLIRQVGIHLAHYSSLHLLDVASAEALKALAQQTEFDCIAAPLGGRKAGAALVAAARSARKSTPIVFLIANAKPHLLDFAADWHCRSVAGKTALPLRAAAEVVQVLALKARVSPALDHVADAQLTLGDGTGCSVQVVDLSHHAAVVRLNSEVAGLGVGGVLCVATSDTTLTLVGQIERNAPVGQGESLALFRLAAKPTGAHGEALRNLIYIGTERQLLKQRRRAPNRRHRRTQRVRPVRRLSVRLVPEGTQRQYYYKVRDISVQGMFVVSKGDFDPGLTSESRVDVTVTSAVGAVHLAARVVRFADSNELDAPYRQGMGLDFRVDSQADGLVGELLQMAGYEVKSGGSLIGCDDPGGALEPPG